MKKPMRHTHDDDGEPHAEAVADAAPDAAAAAAPVPSNATQPMRDVSMYCGTAVLRVSLDKDTPVDTSVALAKLPPQAFVLAGGLWVSEPFDAGTEIEIGNQDDVNTYLSAPLDVAGFVALALKPIGAPREGATTVVGIITGGPLTVGRADFALLYA